MEKAASHTENLLPASTFEKIIGAEKNDFPIRTEQ